MEYDRFTMDALMIDLVELGVYYRYMRSEFDKYEYTSCPCIIYLTKSSSKSIDPSYPVYGGLFRQEAIMLLRRFYIRENEKGIFSQFIFAC